MGCWGCLSPAGRQVALIAAVFRPLAVTSPVVTAIVVPAATSVVAAVVVVVVVT
jgi:hypothetical protein